MEKKCRDCNSDLKSYKPDDIQCNRCGKYICDNCGIIDMGICLCRDCYDKIEKDEYKCYSCEHYMLDNDIVGDYPVCYCKDSDNYRESIYYIPIEQEENCKYYTRI